MDTLAGTSLKPTPARAVLCNHAGFCTLASTALSPPSALPPISANHSPPRYFTLDYEMAAPDYMRQLAAFAKG